MLVWFQNLVSCLLGQNFKECSRCKDSLFWPNTKAALLITFALNTIPECQMREISMRENAKCAFVMPIKLTELNVKFINYNALGIMN